MGKGQPYGYWKPRGSSEAKPLRTSAIMPSIEAQQAIKTILHYIWDSPNIMQFLAIFTK